MTTSDLSKEKDGIVEVEELSESDKKYSERNIFHGPISEFEHDNGNGNGKAKNLVPIQNPDLIEYVVQSIQKTVKCEDALIRQILYTALSSYIEDDPINLGILAPTSEGKTYAITESLQYFPDTDIMYIGQMSPKVLVRQKGILIDKVTGEPIEDKIRELRTKSRELEKKKRATKDGYQKAELNEELDIIDEDIRKLYENSKTLIGLTGKILVFLEQPQHELWNLLKPILSHDKKEIEFPFVDKTANSNAETKDVVVRGWPSCVFCSAKDESKWEIWEEIKSRLLTTSPNMVPQKYQESNKLISQNKGLPNLVQQQIIISGEEIGTSKNCILLIKQKINELKYQNMNKKISLWIPYADLLQKELPANKGTDVRYVKKIFSLLNVIPIVKSQLRMVLMMESESSIIADLQDLKEVLSITQNSDGLPKFKAEFFNKTFLPLFKTKIGPDSKTIINDKGEKVVIKEEEIIAVTTRQLCNYFKEIEKKPISTDNLKRTYLNQLINEGLIDYTESKIHGRENIYYPIVTESLSLLSITDSIDKESQQNNTILEKISKNITEGWIFHEIIGLIRCRFGWGNIETIENIKESDKLSLIDYLKDSHNIQFLDNTYIEREVVGPWRNSLTMSEFIQKYYFPDIVNIPIDNKPSDILDSFAKRSPFLSILGRIDKVDKKEKDNEKQEEIADDSKYKSFR